MMAKASKTNTDKGFCLARQITKKYAKSFYFASLFLNKKQQNACYSIYAICRLSDNTVDDATQNPRDKLNHMQHYIDSAYKLSVLDDPLLKALRATVNHYNIPQELFNELLDGMNMDISINRYSSFEELYKYCYKVAGVVGLIMLKIFGKRQRSPEAEKHAVDLGIAMQLTNILRDIQEDWERGRIYIPRSELQQFSLSEKNFSDKILDGNFSEMLKFQIKRARVYYISADQGLPYLRKECRFVVALMRKIYAEILTEIELMQYAVFSQRAYVPIHKKCLIAMQTYLSMMKED